MKCRRCAGSGWVCEEHDDKPWDGITGQPEGCEPGCAGPGMPCPDCYPRTSEAA